MTRRLLWTLTLVFIAQLTIACERIGITGPSETTASLSSPGMPGDLAATTVPYDLFADEDDTPEELAFRSLATAGDDLEGRVADGACAVRISPKSGYRVGIKGRTFTLRISFPNAADPSECGGWSIVSESDHNIFVGPANVLQARASGVGTAAIKVKVQPSKKVQTNPVKRIVTTRLRFTGGGNNVVWKLRADRWCPTLGWCQ